jgi:hypothetical protein
METLSDLLLDGLSEPDHSFEGGLAKMSLLELSIFPKESNGTLARCSERALDRSHADLHPQWVSERLAEIETEALGRRPALGRRQGGW